jgi:hypothetical protein
MWILKNSKDMLEYIQSRSLSSYNSIKTFNFSTIYTTISHSTLMDKLRELVQLCFIKKNGQCRCKYLVLGKDMKLISSTCSSFLLTTYLFSVVDVFFNRQSTYLWVQTVLLFPPTCSFIRIRQTSYRGFKKTRKEASLIL